MSDPTSPRILVMGAGAIGGTIAAHLTEMGVDVTAVTTNEGIAQAVKQHGFRVTGDGSTRNIKGRMEVGVPEGETFDLVLLATQPPQVEDAARTALPHLADDGNMVVFQNGLCESRIAEIAGPHRVIGGIIAWGASMPEPGLYDRTSSGGFTLGRMEAGRDEALRGLGNMLETIGPVTYTSNLRGARWSKLAINCVISSLGTLGGDRFGPLIRVRRVRRLALEIFAEVVAVANAEGVKLEKVAGTVDLYWLALSDTERKKRGSASLTAKHALLLAIGLRYRRLRSSMLQAIERGRTPAIDFLNAEIVRYAEKHEIDVPVNRLLTERIHAIARGEMSSSRQAIDDLYEATPRTV